MKQFLYLRDLLVFAFRENPLLFAALGISIASVLLELAAMSVLMPMASVASGGELPSEGRMANLLAWLGVGRDGRSLLLLFIGLFAVRVLTQFVGQAMVLYLSKRLLGQMQTRAFHNLLSAVPLKEVERASIGSYISLVGDEAFRASMLITHINQLISSVLLAVLYFVAIAVYSLPVALALAAFLAFTFVILFEAFRLSHRLGHLHVEQSVAANSVFMDALNGLRSVRAFAAERFVSAEFTALIRKYMHTLFLVDAISLLTRLGPALLLFLTVGVCAAFPGAFGNAFDNFAFVVTIVIFHLRFFPVVGQALNILLRIVADARAGRDVTRLIKAYDADAIPIPMDGLVTRDVGEVAISEVAYSHAADKPVLSGLNIRLARGRSYAVVGRSGSGKSTLMDLLLRFYRPDGGQILLDGRPAQDLSEAELRSRLLLVAQDTTIFNDTVGNNVRFGVNATDDEVLQACRIACIDDFVIDLPNGLSTLLAYRGSNLSGGQRQRIGLARALLRRPAVLLLDESTSALDAETRSRVMANLLTEYRDKIIVFVTHDAQVIAAVDEVIDIEALNRVESRP